MDFLGAGRTVNRKREGTEGGRGEKCKKGKA